MATKKSGGEADTKTSRCWPGFEPVPGKAEHEQGSCRKKPASRNGGKEPDRETSRKKQIELGGKRAEQAKSKSPDPAERKSVSRTQTAKSGAEANKKSATKKAATKAPAKSASTRVAKTAAKKTAAKKTPARKTAARKTATRKTATEK